MLLHNYTKDSIHFSEGYIHTTACHFLNSERMGSTRPCSEEYKIRVFLLQTIGIMLLLNYTKHSIPFSEGYIHDCLSFSRQGKNGFNPSLSRSVQLASFSPPCMIQLGWNLLQNETIGVIFSTGMNAKEEISSSIFRDVYVFQRSFLPAEMCIGVHECPVGVARRQTLHEFALSLHHLQQASPGAIP
jgi:hypothetical protein